MILPNTAIKIIIRPIATKITTKGSRTSFPVLNTTIETGTPIIEIAAIISIIFIPVQISFLKSPFLFFGDY